MSLAIKIRRGEGPVSGLAKRLARMVLSFHLPLCGLTKPIFGALYKLHVILRECLIWGLRFFWYEPLFRSQCVSVGERFQMEKLPYLVGRGRIIIGNQVRLSGKPSIGFSNRIHMDPELQIGDDTFVGYDCSFEVAESIKIGKHCLLAGGVKVRDYNGHPIDAAERRAKRPTPAEDIKPVCIGDDVWIGSDAVILKGVTIGDRSVIGAGAVVTHDVPADVVVAGSPARIVKKLSSKAETFVVNGERVDLTMSTLGG